MDNFRCKVRFSKIAITTVPGVLALPVILDQCFSTSGSRPHLGSPSDFRGVARLSTNFLKNDGIFKY